MVIDWERPNPAPVTVLRDYHKLFDGPIRYTGGMNAEEIQAVIVSAVTKKSSVTHRLDEIGCNDFIFVKCANKRVRVLDGNMPVDAQCLYRMYPHGSVYVRLTRNLLRQVHMVHDLLGIT